MNLNLGMCVDWYNSMNTHYTLIPQLAERYILKVIDFIILIIVAYWLVLSNLFYCCDLIS